jgi:hypothetical protein
MNVTKKITVAIGLSSLAALPLMSGPVVTVQVPVPAVRVQVSVPALVVTVAVPDTYVWDGYEYVGVVGTQYYYLGPGDVWLTLDAPRLVRFHDWERGHSDWRTHAVHNERYRHEAHGNDVPRGDAHGNDMGDRHDHGH